MPRPPIIPQRQSTRQVVTNLFSSQNLQLAQLLKQGLISHQKGLLREAQIVYEDILKVQPSHFEALQLLGMLFGQQNCPERAIELMGKALKINPNHAVTNNNMGVALRTLKQLDTATLYFNKAINIDPTYIDAIENLANTQFDLRQFNIAIREFDKLIEIKYDNARAHNQRGMALIELHQYHQALESFDNAICIQPNMAVAHNNRGVTLKELGKFEAAIVSFEMAITINADYAEAYCNRGLVLQEKLKMEAAISSFEIAIHLKPNFSDAHNNLGSAFLQLKKYELAMTCFNKALRIQPDFEEAIYNKGCLLFWQNKVDLAIEFFDKALKLNPSNAHSWWNKSLALLTSGDLDSGWPLFEWRYLAVKDLDKRSFKQPRWTGAESISGKVILLYGEQGLGDTIQFCRYTKIVSSLGAKVILEVPKPLFTLLAKLEGVNQLVPSGDALPEFDYHCPLMSLPLALKTNLHSIPAPTLYIHNHSSINFWRTRLGKRIKPRIGLVWSGNPKHTNDQNRSISLNEFIPWLPNGYEYLSLQKELSISDRVILDENPHILSFADDLNDLSDTAALVACLDLIISVDTSVAHLAGSLGKETWVLLPFTPDWRWMLDRQDSPWYPSIKLYRQQTVGDWTTVFKEIQKDLIGREIKII
jgi:tetratricopeptide (TPR) repeat protein